MVATHNNSSFRIRPAEQRDLPEARAIIIAAFADRTIHHLLEQRYGEMGGRPWQDWKADELERIFAAHKDWVHVAEIGDRVVGAVTFSLDERRQIGRIGNNGVAPAFQGRGIGTAMYRYVLDLFVQAGMRYAEVETGTNELYAAARRGYEKVGFWPLRQSVQYFQELKDLPRS